MTPEVTESQSLSLTARPGDGGIRTRRVAILVADGVDGHSVQTLRDRLFAAGAVPRFVGSRLGSIESTSGAIEVDTTVEAMPSVLFDAVVIPEGTHVGQRLGVDGRTVEFVKDQYRHCKPMLVFGAAAELLQKVGIPETLPSGAADPGLIVAKASGVDSAIRGVCDRFGQTSSFRARDRPAGRLERR